MEICESNMLFSFHDGVSAIKYDDQEFYRVSYNVMECSKGVDIIADSERALYFIEVKNCEGTAENQDKWRRHYAGTRNMDTLASEIALKVAHTCACLAGVSTYGSEGKQNTAPLLEYANALHDRKIASHKKKMLVLLCLEGDFSCKSRSNTQIYLNLQNKIQRRLKWLNCSVSVGSTQTFDLKEFDVKHQRQPMDA